MTKSETTGNSAPAAQADFPFLHTLRVRYAEVDAQAIVYNAHYLTYADIAITELLRTLNFDYSLAATQRAAQDFHTVKVVLEYQHPAHYDEEVTIGVRVGRIGRSSITWRLAFFRQPDVRLLATAEVVWVYTDQQQQRSTPLPPGLVAELEMLVKR